MLPAAAPRSVVGPGGTFTGISYEVRRQGQGAARSNRQVGWGHALQLRPEEDKDGRVDLRVRFQAVKSTVSEVIVVPRCCCCNDGTAKKVSPCSSKLDFMVSQCSCVP